MGWRCFTDEEKRRVASKEITKQARDRHWPFYNPNFIICDFENEHLATLPHTALIDDNCLIKIHGVSNTD